jgi:hypothetical protein
MQLDQLTDIKADCMRCFFVNEKLITLKIGEAARAGAFDWNSCYLEPLRDLSMAGFEP